MGSYATLTIGDFPLASSKSEADPSILAFFSDAERKLGEYTNEDGEQVRTVKYVANLGVVRDRLDYMGFTLTVVREAFQTALAEHVANEMRFTQHLTGALENNLANHKSDIELIRGITLDQWLEAFRYIIVNQLQSDSRYDRLRRLGTIESHPELVCYLLGKNFAEGIWFPSYDFREFIRAAVEITGTDAVVTYDLTELYYYQEDGDLDLDLCAWARHGLELDSMRHQKTVVLTEGSSDCWAIERAFNLFYPHLRDNYSFMDFDGVRAAGGAGVLVATIKAFAGAGIANRTVAFFDNDTAAASALRGLRSIQIPRNIRIIQYPQLKFACNYPTLGPHGLANMDVNGLAGGLELYFGSDVLQQPDGSLTPVHWRGYDEAVRAYQGELAGKAQLQSRYSDKLSLCETDPSLMKDYDWAGMRLIAEQLRTAFH